LFEGKLNKIILLFIYLSIFINSFTFFTYPFEFYFGYLIYIVLLPVFMMRYKISKELFLILFILLVSGIFNIYLGKNTAALFFKVYLGVMMSYLFYYYVIIESKFNIKKLFEYYLYGCFIVSLIGLFQFISFKVGFTPGYNYKWLLNKWGVIVGGNLGIRVNAIFAEPSHYAEVTSSAVFVAIYDLIMKRPYYYSKKQAILVILVFLLTFSSTGYIVILMSMIFLLMNFGLVRYLFAAIPVIYGAFLLLYNNVPDFKLRFDSQIEIYNTGKFDIAMHHGSTIIQYNNYHVAVENLKENPFFGTGLGSHPVAFEKFSLTKHIMVYGFSLNSADANSMMYRLMSETGIFGVFIMFFVIFRYYVSRNKNDDDLENYYWIISNAILVMIVAKLIRQGHYFLNGFPFFIILYYYNFKKYKEFLLNR
jgi:hypothetical protein